MNIMHMKLSDDNEIFQKPYFLRIKNHAYISYLTQIFI